ncbi:MAG: 5-carboxymethyl-2-hydroxymuconate Delta-isomerase [Motiliproteus sp.]
MPHVVIEYSQDLADSMEFSRLLNAAHQGALRSDLFEPETIKVRACEFEHYLVAGEPRSFIHLRAQILSGRSEAQKKHLSRCLLEAVADVAVTVTSLSVDIVDMDRFCYDKRLL